jgi:ribosomal protein S18 acetylase RimI-like enzyme
MSELCIEQAQDATWRRVRAVRLRALEDFPDALGSTLAHELTFADAEWRLRLARVDAATFLATLNGADVGITVVAKNEDGEASIYSVWVAPEARGKGAGDALMSAAVVWAKAHAFVRITLDVGDFNTPAIRLYERHGFVPTGEIGTLPPPRTHITEHTRALILK